MNVVELAKSSQTVSLWMATQRMPERPVLDSDKRADVCIVGAGITGLLSAYLLMKEGVRPVVLDDGPIAGGETQRTSAHLSFVFDHGFSTMEQLHDRDNFRLAAES